MRMVEKSSFTFELNEKPNEGGQFATYGQTAVLDHFVRNQHFWNGPFMDACHFHRCVRN